MTTNKQSASNRSGQSADEELSISRYLADTPDFFDRHPELLEVLAVPHAETGSAVSLVERQVRVLRERVGSLSAELRNLIDIARENDQLGHRLQRFAVAMIESTSLDDVLDTAQDMLRQEFGLDGVAVRITGNPRPACPRAEFVAEPDPALDELLDRLAAGNGQPLCGSPLAERAFEQLFAIQGTDLRSAAAIALNHRGLRGVLVLGSRDPQRFRPDMGTVYLDRVGDLLMSAMARHLVTSTE